MNTKSNSKSKGKVGFASFYQKEPAQRSTLLPFAFCLLPFAFAFLSRLLPSSSPSLPL
jgi:hypothetical protein